MTRDLRRPSEGQPVLHDVGLTTEAIIFDVVMFHLVDAARLGRAPFEFECDRTSDPERIIDFAYVQSDYEVDGRFSAPGTKHAVHGGLAARPLRESIFHSVIRRWPSCVSLMSTQVATLDQRGGHPFPLAAS